MLKIVVKIAISAALIAWRVYGTDSEMPADIMSQITFNSLFLAFALLCGIVFGAGVPMGFCAPSYGGQATVQNSLGHCPDRFAFYRQW